MKDTMQLSDITTSLELSKQLKEAVYPQESLFYWSTETTSKEVLEKLKVKRYIPQIYDRSVKELTGEVSTKHISAPTATELLERLPEIIHLNRNQNVRSKSENYYLTIQKLGLFEVGYEGENLLVSFEDRSLADALAKMWLYLKKKRIIK